MSGFSCKENPGEDSCIPPTIPDWLLTNACADPGGHCEVPFPPPCWGEGFDFPGRAFIDSDIRLDRVLTVPAKAQPGGEFVPPPMIAPLDTLITNPFDQQAHSADSHSDSLSEANSLFSRRYPVDAVASQSEHQWEDSAGSHSDSFSELNSSSGRYPVDTVGSQSGHHWEDSPLESRTTPAIPRHSMRGLAYAQAQVASDEERRQKQSRKPLAKYQDEQPNSGCFEVAKEARHRLGAHLMFHALYPATDGSVTAMIVQDTAVSRALAKKTMNMDTITALTKEMAAGGDKAMSRMRNAFKSRMTPFIDHELAPIVESNIQGMPLDVHQNLDVLSQVHGYYAFNLQYRHNFAHAHRIIVPEKRIRVGHDASETTGSIYSPTKGYPRGGPFFTGDALARLTVALMAHPIYGYTANPGLVGPQATLEVLALATALTENRLCELRDKDVLEIQKRLPWPVPEEMPTKKQKSKDGKIDLAQPFKFLYRFVLNWLYEIMDGRYGAKCKGELQRKLDWMVHEVRVFYAAANTSNRLATQTTVYNFLAGQFATLTRESFNTAVAKYYPLEAYNNSFSLQGQQMYGELRYICSALLITGAATNFGLPGYQYHWDNPTIGSDHGIDLYAFFCWTETGLRSKKRVLEKGETQMGAATAGLR
ncbi:hypothetical protein HMN09_00359500 [Mycena chlorophos]|uniref:Uncharacterized protein n=1 Tax=Mycena chlorophos TaxID=658473 RepID=A0A8H6TJL9_MYCCL|nr:hypothetical protein HMN09_00359500 [Mycena chlorophos]